LTDATTSCATRCVSPSRADDAQISDQLRDRAAELGVEVDELRERVLAMTPGQLAEYLEPYVDRRPDDLVSRTIRALRKIAFGALWLADNEEAFKPRWDPLQESTLYTGAGEASGINVLRSYPSFRTGQTPRCRAPASTIKVAQSTQSSPTSTSAGPEDLKLDPGGLAVGLDGPHRAAPVQRRLRAVNRRAPDHSATAIDGCREINLVTVRKPVHEPSRSAGAGPAELPVTH
jgi:hypothetical protein